MDEVNLNHLKGYNGNPLLKRTNEAIGWTPKMVEEYVKCSKDPVYFIETYMKIINVDKGLINFKLYPYQKDIINSFANNRFNIAERQNGITINYQFSITPGNYNIYQLATYLQTALTAQSTYYTYTVDWTLLKGLLIETKGYLADYNERRKYVLIKEQHPEIDLRFVFADPNKKCGGMKTTHAQWADKYGFKWCSIKDTDQIKQWIVEDHGKTSCNSRQSSKARRKV